MLLNEHLAIAIHAVCGCLTCAGHPKWYGWRQLDEHRERPHLAEWRIRAADRYRFACGSRDGGLPAAPGRRMDSGAGTD
jgi:hypothetical protein